MRAGRLLCLSTLLLTVMPAAPAQQIPELKACERALELPPLTPVDVELTTVTHKAATLTWLTCAAGAPAPADSTVTYAKADAYYPQVSTVVARGKTAFHVVHLTGLDSGATYAYSVFSNQLPGAVDRLNPGVFTTLSAPGRELFRFAVLADTHIGEEVSGLATSSPSEFPPGYRSKKPYPEIMLAAAVKAINKTGVALSLVAADDSAHGELTQLDRARQLLDGLDAPYLVARGAHDRANQYEEAVADCGVDGDCFRAVFRPSVAPQLEPRPLPVASRVQGWRFIALDSVNPSSGLGELKAGQLDWLEAQLEDAESAKQPSVIFFHHPVAEYSSTAALPPAVFGVNQQDAQNFLSLIGDYDVRLVINAHTHRNWIAYSPHTGSMPIIEVGPTKEYPAGYTLVRVFDGGLMREWHPIDCRFCAAWRETTRGEYFSLYPLYTTGSLRDRNFVHRFDAPDVPGIPSLPLGLWPPGLPGEA